MRTLSILFLILWAAPGFAQTPAPAATTADTSETPLTFQKLAVSSYNQPAERVQLADPSGLYQVYLDKLVQLNNGINRVSYHCVIRQGDKVITDQTIYVDGDEVLMSASHVFDALINDEGLTSVSPSPKSYKSNTKRPVVICVFKNTHQANPYHLEACMDNLPSPILNVTVNRYEFQTTDADPNEQVVTYNHFNLPTRYDLETARIHFDDQARQRYKKEKRLIPEYSASYKALPIDQDVYDLVQKRLEDKLKDTSLSTLDQFKTHEALALLYQIKSHKNPSNLDAFGQMAQRQTQAAMALQPQCPLKEKITVPIPPFDFLGQVEDPGQVNGQYGFKLFRVSASGKAKLKSSDWVDVAQAKNIYRKQPGAADNNQGFLHDPTPRGVLSPTGLYRVSLDQDRNYDPNDLPPLGLNLANINDGSQTFVTVPDTGYVQTMGWAPSTDRFYFMVLTSGAFGNTGSLWQLDAATGAVKKIGYCSKDVKLSPDGNWILWGNGGVDNTNQDSTSGFNLFNIAKGISYRITHSLEPKYFMGWETGSSAP